MKRALVLTLPLLALLGGCGGMNRAVGVLPTTTDELARKTEPFRAGRSERLTPPPPGL